MSSPNAFPLDGGCDCGAVRCRLQTAPLFVHCCHCRWCQRESGASFALNAMVEADRVALLAGVPDMVDTPSASGKGQQIARCPSCRVALWSHYAGAGDRVAFVRVGTLDAPDHLSPDIHIFTGSKQPWTVLPPGVPAVPEYYDREAHWPAQSLARHRVLLAQIRVDDLRGPEIRALLEEHLRNMAQLSPPESVHALDIGALRQADITFWTMWCGAELMGCGALKELEPGHGEIKSMRTTMAFRGQGVARRMLHHIVNVAQQRGYARLSLETGSIAAFAPARALYEGFGFAYCAPFADYVDDPNSVFMSRAPVSAAPGRRKHDRTAACSAKVLQ